jgi:hypothetical protein
VADRITGTLAWTNRIAGENDMTHIATDNPIVGTGGKIFVYDVELDQVAVTTADSTAWTLTDSLGTTISSGTMTYVDPLPVDGFEDIGGWYANVTWPSAAQRVHIHVTITKSSVAMKWHQQVSVDAFVP